VSSSVDSPLVRQLTIADLTAIVEPQEAVSAELPVGFIRSKTETEVRAYLDRTLGLTCGIVEGAAGSPGQERWGTDSSYLSATALCSSREITRTTGHRITRYMSAASTIGVAL